MARLICSLFFLLVFNLVHAEWKGFEYDPSLVKPWVELQPELPSYPRDENLLPFEVSTLSKNQFYVDSSSISVSEDGVVRYSVVIKSAGGAKNISYEGIRCETVEIKTYAFGRADNTWSKVRVANWRAINLTGSNAYAKTLFQDFFCPGLLIIKNPAEAITAFKKGMHSRATGD